MLTRENVLPIGSVVTLEGAARGKFLITGYYPIAEGALYDYCAVSYPLGEMCIRDRPWAGIDEKVQKYELILSKMSALLHRLFPKRTF